MSLFVLIPVKGFYDGKTRLAPVLDPDERRRLNLHMFRKVLATVLHVAPKSRVLVISNDDEPLILAARSGAHTVRETGKGGLNAALTQAAQMAVELGATSVLSVSCDLPLISASDLEHMIKAAPPRGLAIAPDLRDEGTNALVMTPPLSLRFSFGELSFQRHYADAAEAGMEIRIVRRQGLSFDLDTPEDLAAFNSNL